MSSSTPFLSAESGGCDDFLSGAEKPPRRSQELQHSRIGVVGFFITTIIGVCAGFVFGRMIGPANLITHCNTTISVAADIQNLPVVPVVFLEDADYSGPPSKVSNAAWEALIPEGRGFVEVGSSEGNQDRYCISVFHQLHCLDMLRRDYYNTAESSMDNGRDHHSSSNSSNHVKHCFDYLRQSLMCAADSALEERDDAIGGVRGWGTIHQCRDFQALHRWASEHRYNDEGGIVN